MKIKVSRRVVFGRVLTVFNILSPFLDIFVACKIMSAYPKGDKMHWLFMFLGLALLGFTLFRSVRGALLVIRSRTKAREYLLNNRVLPIDGKQGVGKSSLSCYFLKMSGGECFSNVPIKIHGKFTRKLSPKVLNIRTRVPERSALLVDEANLFYHNLFTDTDENLFGQAVLCQCIRHFFDGNIIYCAVDTTRLPKIIRDNYSARLQVVESQSFQIAVFGAWAVRLLARFMLPKDRIFTGLRVWKAQHFEKLSEPNYIGIVGQKENEFSPLLTFATYQTFGLTAYDDRYMRFYYDDKPEEPLKRWESLSLNYTDFNNLYDGQVIKYLNSIKEEPKAEPNTKKIKIKKEVENNDTGSNLETT